jgi:tetratricopeptide repeat protein
MRAFIVRPFGIKNKIDFDKVEADLIGPALTSLGIEGRTTGTIMAPGNIREDMFQLLLTADLVIADITIHNANAYYELGIRHALRDRVTVLLRGVGEENSEIAPDAVPFDILTDRYLTYKISNPAGAVKDLAAAITQGQATKNRDSPVFKLLPKLRSPLPDELMAVPVDFEEDVARVTDAIPADGDQRTLFSGDLALLAYETRWFSWAGAGLRFIGRKQFDGRHFESARLTWEQTRQRDPDDLEANLRLTTICQKLGDLPASNAAAQRVLRDPDLPLSKRAEIHALHASNLKVQWLKGLQESAADQRSESALRSGLLAESAEAYEAGFKADRNHYYSGINAYALRVIQRELAQKFPKVWEVVVPEAEGVEAQEQASRELNRVKDRTDKLATGVALALESGDAFDGKDNEVWRAFTAADRACLINTNSERVKQAYGRVIEKYKQTYPFAVSSARAQLELLQLVGVLEDNAKAGLSAFPPKLEQKSSERGRILLFTGHRIDDEDREAKGKPARFPRTNEAETAARDAIAASIKRAMGSPRGVAFGIAGGASGGDILFHEACEQAGIGTWLYLALPPARYKNESVRGAGDVWLDRFDKVQDRLQAKSRQLSTLRSEAVEPDKLPRWLQTLPNYDIWQRSNLWMLNNALAFGPDRVTLIALWDGEKEGDGPGGTSHLVDAARDAGAEVDIIRTKPLFGLPA